MEMRKAELVFLPGCKNCNKGCKFNHCIADKERYDGQAGNPYGCNSVLKK